MNNNKIMTTAIAIALIIGVAIVLFAFINGETKKDIVKEQARISTQTKDDEAERELNKKIRMNACISQAVEDHWSIWKLNCENYGTNIVKKDNGETESCSLPASLADDIDAALRENKDRCVDAYK